MSQSNGTALIVSYYQQLLAAGAADWDIMALSYYPHYGAGNTSDLVDLAAVQAAFPSKPIVLAETSLAYSGRTPDGSEFPFTEAGQLL